MTPSQEEIEAVAKAIYAADWDAGPWERAAQIHKRKARKMAEAAIAAAEKVRARNFEEGAGSGNAPDRNGESDGVPDPPDAVCTPSSGDSEAAPTPSPDRVEDFAQEMAQRIDHYFNPDSIIGNVDDPEQFYAAQGKWEERDAEVSSTAEAIVYVLKNEMPAAIAALQPGPDEVDARLREVDERVRQVISAHIGLPYRSAPTSRDEWGPRCAGCDADEFRHDGYCSMECRDSHAFAADILTALTEKEER
jgi:hypothetical protein